MAYSARSCLSTADRRAALFYGEHKKHVFEELQSETSSPALPWSRRLMRSAYYQTPSEPLTNPAFATCTIPASRHLRLHALDGCSVFKGQRGCRSICRWCARIQKQQ